MTKFIFTYDIEIDVPEGKDGRMEAFYWHDRLLRDPDYPLPEHVHWVRTMPQVKEDTND
jgi:hypothetical protein